ncbi:MAG TPA: hypothetical protein VNW30_01680 [Opitutaceae bacterium]|jgi:hypothetical protein|nr:hypothetical protein [Opitutaceae bacterium]
MPKTNNKRKGLIGESFRLKDTIVEEVRRIREERAAKFKFDVTKIMKNAQRRQRTMKRKVVSFSSSTPASRRAR